MSHLEGKNKWYALFVKTGEEEKVREKLEYRFKGSELSFIVPKRKLMERKEGKWKEKIRTLFPGYILVNGTIGAEEYYLLAAVPGLLKVLKNNWDPLEIPEQDMTVIKKLICNGETIDQSRVFIESKKVIVIDGPLLGLEGFIHSIDKRKGRAKIQLNFAGEPRLVDLSVFIIQSV